MKKTFFAFLLSVFVVGLPCSFAWGDNPNGRKVTNSAGVKGTSYSIKEESGGGIAGGCTMEQIGKSCKTSGAEKAVCIKVVPKPGEAPQPSCSARICKEGYLLVLKANGTSRGICRSVEAAEDNCKKKFKKENKECPEGREPSPLIEANPNNSEYIQAYKDTECFCADKNMVVYECGDGTGNPPKDPKTYRNVDDVTVAKNTCTKAGSTFTGWKCGDNVLSPDGKFSIENKTTCVAQWDTNEYTVNYECGDGATGFVPQQKFLYNTDVTLPGYNAECVKEKSTFTGWVCDGNNVNKTFTITKDTKCVAQWKNCDACNPGDGCTCDIKVEGNQCKYITGTQANYVMVSGENTDTPQCILAGEKDCKDSGGRWQDGKCKCNPDISETHWDIKNKRCICDDVQKIIENGQCIKPTKCPDETTGIYPNCDCGDGKDYDRNTNQCVSKCNENIATWENGACKCKDTEKLYNNGQCECPSDKPEYVDGQCIKPTKCPADATVNGQSCECKDPDKKYNENTKKCECSSDKVMDSNGRCMKCPNDSTGNYPDCKCNDEYKKYDEQKNECVEDELKKKQKAYDDAKENEQSFANRTLTAVTTAATGIGGMELARGLAEQNADKNAEQDMAAYIATFRCEYGNGKSVRGGPDEIELPGGNNQNLMNLRADYFALASDLKERKNALGMKPGIESEEILDKANLGLYDDENTGITSGAEVSRYRAQMLQSEKDQSELDELSAASKRRVVGGAVAAGVGVVGGVLGDSLINGELGEKLKDAIKNKKVGKETRSLLEQEAKALDELKACLKTAGVKDTDDLNFEKFYPSIINLQTYDYAVDCKNRNNNLFKAGVDVGNLKAVDLFKDTTDANDFYEHMKQYFAEYALNIMTRYIPGRSDSQESKDTGRINKLKNSIEDREKKFKDAEKKDIQSASKSGIDFGNISELVTGNGLKEVSALFSGVSGESDVFDLSQFLQK